ncbi:hypothetical protein JF544_01710 [Halobacillus kuroshimensis]|uniref:Uncharacterized protein n=1 Tax=Halobacillus kuroshimensis TaxID=302481 RepID=A0ABS3DRG8_9BACI|nr:hypothetical protein [Halobacillus kuroshimensis]MBN8233936.1 hypothetical protein [Halobacillus kuroshimensis]
MEKEKLYRRTAASSLVISLLMWVPNLVFQTASPLWLLTFIIAPIGAAFALLAKNYWLIAANIIMFFSFFILMAGGYWIQSFIDGQP